MRLFSKEKKSEMNHNGRKNPQKILFTTQKFWHEKLYCDLSLHCTDFFIETKNRSYCLHVLEEVELQMEVKMRSGGGEPLGEPLLTSSRPPFGLHDLQNMETIR